MLLRVIPESCVDMPRGRPVERLPDVGFDYDSVHKVGLLRSGVGRVLHYGNILFVINYSAPDLTCNPNGSQEDLHWNYCFQLNLTFILVLSILYIVTLYI